MPEQHSDYDVKHFLQRDGEVLGPGQATAEIERIMPEKIARFFLFDGELLQEYEDLLRNESDMGRQISEAIEQILGVPVLTRSRATLAKLLDDYGKKEAKSAQANTITSELGTQMNVLLDQRQVLQDGLDDMEASLAQLRDEDKQTGRAAPPQRAPHGDDGQARHASLAPSSRSMGRSRLVKPKSPSRCEWRGSHSSLLVHLTSPEACEIENDACSSRRCDTKSYGLRLIEG